MPVSETDDVQPILGFVPCLCATREVDYAMQTKHFSGEGHQGRYSPGNFTGSTKEAIRGNPLYAPDERILKEDRELRALGCGTLCSRQLLPRASDTPRHARDGGWPDG